MAQIQTANVIALAAVIVAVFGVIASFITVKIARDKMIEENNDKMASKVFVMDKISKVDADVVNLKENFKQHKIDNENDKIDLKEGYKTEFEYIKQFLSDIKEDLKIIKQKSA